MLVALVFTMHQVIAQVVALQRIALDNIGV